jgi:hypothetical protein
VRSIRVTIAIHSALCACPSGVDPAHFWHPAEERFHGRVVPGGAPTAHGSDHVVATQGSTNSRLRSCDPRFVTHTFDVWLIFVPTGLPEAELADLASVLGVAPTSAVIVDTDEQSLVS